MTVSIEVIGVDEVLSLLNNMPEIGKKVVSASINKTTTHTKSEVTKTVRLKSTVKAKAAKSSMSVPKKASVNSLNSSIVIKGDKIPLIGYQTSKTKKGIKARIFKTAPLTLRPHSFYAIMKNGHKGVFWRDKASSGRLVARLGITELKDKSVPELVDDPEIWNDIQNDADIFLQRQLSNNLDYFLNQ